MSIEIEPTPNPNALKFITELTVKAVGNATFNAPSECEQIPLAHKIFSLRGVDQVHFFQNVITVSKFGFEPWDDLEPSIVQVIQENIEKHDASFQTHNPEEERRKNLTPELQEIEAIIDRTIRPGLQGDGGDLQCLSYENKVLVVQYQGACGTCPSSTMGTLEAIKAILRDEYEPEIEVYAAPAS